MTITPFDLVDDRTGCEHNLHGRSEVVKTEAGVSFRFQRCVKCRHEIGFELDKDGNPAGIARLWKMNEPVSTPPGAAETVRSQPLTP